MLTRFSIYKYVKTDRGWRYCKPAYAKNQKIKPNVVMVGDCEETHTEGAYYFQLDGKWERVGESAAEAQAERAKRLARQEYEQKTGEKLPGPEAKGPTLRDAIGQYLAELQLKVASKNRQPRTYAAASQALNEFAEQSGVRHLHEVIAAHIDRYTAWVIQNSPTKSARTAQNKFLWILQFLKHYDSVPTVGIGGSSRPLGMRDAPRYVEDGVVVNTQEELMEFFHACDHRQLVTFQTFNRTGMREMELVTLRRQDCHLDGPNPCLDITERPEHGFIPKWYQIRTISIDPLLAAMLRGWLASHNRKLVFGTDNDRPDGHLLRICNRIAKCAGLDPKRFWLHKFRANYATWCIRRGMDLETLRAQLGHRDTESLRRYVEALKGEQRAAKVAEVWEVMREQDMSSSPTLVHPNGHLLHRPRGGKPLSLLQTQSAAKTCVHIRLFCRPPSSRLWGNKATTPDGRRPPSASSTSKRSLIATV